MGILRQPILPKHPTTPKASNISDMASPHHNRQELLDIFNAALTAADPYHAILESACIEQSRLQFAETDFDLDSYQRIIVIGAGKATARMAQAVESLLGDRLTSGLIIVKEGHTAPLDIIKQIEAGHPVPSEAGEAATRNILQLLNTANETTLVICLLSGGASALLVAPAGKLTLQDKQETTQLLLNAGANIYELNAVRKHISAIKGGALARAAFPAQLVTLILSDVINNPLDVIASGPTAADNSTFSDAWHVIEKYDLATSLPSRVCEHLKDGIAAQLPETVKQGDPCLTKTQNIIVTDIRQALTAAQDKAMQLGFTSKILSDSLSGEARDVATWLAQTARSELEKMKPGERRCLLSGGETTVTVRGTGMGGRNQELALAFALEVEGEQGITLLSAGTDGTDGTGGSDGTGDAAGAIVNGDTVTLAISAGITPSSYLDNNDSYSFFKNLDIAIDTQTQIVTGPTGTNVMDIQILILCKA